VSRPTQRGQRGPPEPDDACAPGLRSSKVGAWPVPSAAARHHFDLDARRLSREQAAALAAILPSPRKRSARHPSPRVLRKQQWILERMHASN
jgi:hypothetical protein